MSCPERASDRGAEADNRGMLVQVYEFRKFCVCSWTVGRCSVSGAPLCKARTQPHVPPLAVMRSPDAESCEVPGPVIWALFVTADTSAAICCHVAKNVLIGSQLQL